VIVGTVSANQIVIGVPFRAAGGLVPVIECVVDTGFTGYLTLPPAAVEALGLPYVRTISATLADNSTVDIDAHVAGIDQDSGARDVEVLATGARPLVGTLLLAGHALRANFVEDGAVTIEPQSG
jgi:clan AA aspartic protease